MDTEFIPKSRLYRENYLPGGTIRLREGAYAKVLGTKNHAPGLNNVDPLQLMDVIRRYVNEWAEMRNAAVDDLLTHALASGNLHIQCPSEIYVTPFPLIMKCSECEVIDFYSGPSSEDALVGRLRRRTKRISGKPRISCKTSGCRGHMVQLPFLSVHRCGSLAPINIPPQVRRTPNVVFRDQSGTFVGSSFIDQASGAKIAAALSFECPSCRSRYSGLNELSQRGTPITNGDGFFPHSVQFISLDPVTGQLVSDVYSHFLVPGSLTGLANDLAEGVVFGLLGGVDASTLKGELKSLLDSGGTDSSAAESVEKELSQQREALKLYQPQAEGNPVIATVVKTLEEKIELLERQLASAKGIFKTVRQYIREDDVIRTLAGERRTHEAVFFRGAFKERTLDDQILNESNPSAKKELIKQRDILSKRYGVRTVAHISDLNVVLSSLGYTREKRAPNTEAHDIAPLVLRGFEDEVDDNLRGSAIAYAMSAETEGILLRFDPCKILQWCHDQFAWPISSPTCLTDSTEAHAHLLRTSPALGVAPGEVSRIMREHTLDRAAPFHLLHTISHCLLSVAKRHTGYDDKSLSEYLLPMDLSLLIYVSSVQNYTAGGLLTLFKHYIEGWFDDASSFALQCVFDPVCSDQGSSCSGCVQTVLGCETFNRGLSRSYLFGGDVMEEERSLAVRRGFWA